MRAALDVHPLIRRDVVSSAAWLFVVYRWRAQSRHVGRAQSQADARRLFLAPCCMPSVLGRPPLGRPLPASRSWLGVAPAAVGPTGPLVYRACPRAMPAFWPGPPGARALGVPVRPAGNEDAPSTSLGAAIILVCWTLLAARSSAFVACVAGENTSSVNSGILDLGYRWWAIL